MDLALSFVGAVMMVRIYGAGWSGRSGVLLRIGGTASQATVILYKRSGQKRLYPTYPRRRARRQQFHDQVNLQSCCCSFLEGGNNNTSYSSVLGDIQVEVICRMLLDYSITTVQSEERGYLLLARWSCRVMSTAF